MELHEFQDLRIQRLFAEAGFPSSDIHFCDIMGWRTWDSVWDKENQGWVELPDCLRYYENQICLDTLLVIYVNIDIFPNEVREWYQNKLYEYDIWR